MMGLSLDEEYRRVMSFYMTPDMLLKGIEVERKMIADRTRRLDQLEDMALGLKPQTTDGEKVK